MARRAGSNGEETAAAARRAAVSLFARYGYEAVSMRALAGEIGVQPAALYRYWATKQDLLADVMIGFLDDALAALSDTVPNRAQTRRDPVAALQAFTRSHLNAVITRPEEVFLSSMELRSLTPENFDQVEQRRAVYEQRLEAILTIGVEQGVFQVGHIRVETMALLAMLVGVATWYRPGGPLAAEDVVEIYGDLVLRSVGARAR